jgi:hypothetical protein
VAEFLEKNYDQFFQEYTNLLNSANYVTKRQSLKVTCLRSSLIEIAVGRAFVRPSQFQYHDQVYFRSKQFEIVDGTLEG